MKRFAANLMLAISFLVLVSTVSAQYGEPQPSFSIMIDKMVGKPVNDKGGSADGNYVDNLSPSDPRYQPGNEVFFKLKVKNTSDEKLKDVTIKDFLPEFVSAIESKFYKISNLREITIDAGDLEIDEEKEYIVKARLLEQDKLPSDKGLICLVNKAQASNDKSSDEDTAQFCVEKEVLGVVSVPSAGPEMGILLITGQITMLGLGIALKKKLS